MDDLRKPLKEMDENVMILKQRTSLAKKNQVKNFYTQEMIGTRMFAGAFAVKQALSIYLF